MLEHLFAALFYGGLILSATGHVAAAWRRPGRVTTAPKQFRQDTAKTGSGGRARACIH